MSIDKVYNSAILDYAASIQHIGRLDTPDGTAKAHSKLCGSTVVVDVRVAGGRVVEFAQDVKACALGQASSAILAKHVVGSTLDELQKVRTEMTAMLKIDGPPPTGKFEELRFLEPVREYRARHASTLLVFDAVVEATEQALSRDAALA